MFWLVVATLCSVSFFYLFIFVDAKGKGIQSIIKRFLYEQVPSAIKTALRTVAGDCAVKFLERSTNYICMQANPIIQMMYLTLAVGGYIGYFVYGFCHVPNAYVPEYHKYTSIVAMAGCYYTYYKASFTNPGYINAKTPKTEIERAMKRYSYDKIMFEPNGWCQTCNIPKPARSKHCSMCNSCCEKFDHHCVWINSCVGLHNYKYFLAFLISHFFICIYGMVLGLGITLHIIDQENLMNQAIQKNGKVYQGDPWVIFQYLQFKYEHFAVVVFLCVIVTFMLFLFLAYHTFLIHKDLTTNEQSKRGKLLSFLTNKLSFVTKWEKARLEKRAFKPAAKALEKFVIKGDIQGELTDAQVTAVKEKVQGELDRLTKGGACQGEDLEMIMKRLWNPNKFDLNGNSEEVSLEQKKKTDQDLPPPDKKQD